MKIYIIFILLILKSSIVWAQSLSNEELVNYKVKETKVKLKEIGVDTILTYQLKPTFSLIKVIPLGSNLDSCESESPIYVLWKLKGKLFVEKINSCFTYRPVQINSANIDLLLNSNPDILKSNPIKPFKFRDKSGKILNMTVDHTIIGKLTIHFGKHKRKILIDYYNLNEKADEHLNLNYKANQNNIQFKIVAEIEKLVKDL